MVHHIPYSVHPTVAYSKAILENLPKKTGKSLQEWLDLVNQSGVDDRKGRKAWLKNEHGLGGTTATMIADRSLGQGLAGNSPAAYLEAARGYVENMYAGPKAHLLPLHQRLLAMALELGEDVRVSPCKTIVPLYRKHVFAEIKPATRKRIDFGLALRDCERTLSARLIDTGGLQKKDRITHRFVIAEMSDIDGEVAQWLQIAYELDSRL